MARAFSVSLGGDDIIATTSLSMAGSVAIRSLPAFSKVLMGGCATANPSTEQAGFEKTEPGLARITAPLGKTAGRKATWSKAAGSKLG